jgi:hypothetical protein
MKLGTSTRRDIWGELVRTKISHDAGTVEPGPTAERTAFAVCAQGSHAIRPPGVVAHG